MDTIDLNSSPADNLTPVKARLGRFLDEYSPEHLNLTPKHIQKQSFADVTPTVYSSEKEQVIQHRSRTGRALRTKPKNVPLNSSFEENQSFPGLRRKLRPIKMDLETPTKVKTALELVRVDGPYGLRFNNSLSTTETTGSPLQQQGGWQHCINTRKAIFTIEPSTSKILIVNNKACCLLGYTSNDLVGLRLFDLMRNKSPIAFTVQEDQDEYHPSVGPIILLSGKVIELVSKDGCSVQVSLWIRQLDTEGPCLVVAEPVRCKNVIFTVDPETWLVLSCDNEDAALLFQAESTDKLIGVPMTTLIPSIQLPAGERGTISKSMAKQKVTGRTLEGGCFPLSLRISRQESSEPRSTVKSNKKKIVLEINVRVTFNVSGLLVVDEGGTVTACNHYFAQLTFGKPDCEVIGRSVQELIPRYCSEADRVPPRQATLALNDTQDDTESDTDEDSCDAYNGSQKSACMSSNVQQSTLSQTTREKSSSALCLDKSCSLVTHTPTPTQDMVSSISTTEQRNTETTSAVPDVTSAMSGISIDDENYCHTSISKSRSENILRSEQSSSVQIAMPQGMEKSDSIYYTSHNSQELTPTGGKRVRAKDPSLRLSLDSNKCRSLKAVPFLPGQLKDDKSSVSLDFCDSNETSADFLTPINETALSRGDFEGISSRNCNESIDSLSNDTDLETQTESAPRRIYDDEAPETPCLARRLLRAHVATSTPQPLHHKTDERCECSTDCQHRDGTYRGVVLHRDGSELNVVYTVSNMQLGTGRWVQCVWLGVQLEDAVMSNALVSSIASTTDTSLVQGNKSVSSRPQSMSLMSQCGEEQVAGEYHKNYATLKQIGKGAYGCVKMAYRRSDRLMVIAKFILKEKVGPQFWVSTPDSRVMPLEISLLRNLKHPNIVSVIDVFENDKYFQLVMEKHGAGMDLFEFIERRPTLSEPLVSYIFRQIGQAVEYLHKLNVLHRDIKDENVIIDDKFHVKLIDFGSAAFMSPDVLFSTFYGTTEYCSPEVLAGNKYAGPELEMWSMGTTLYVLTFFVNPFSDIEDTVHGQLQFPHQISEELEQLLRWMLCKEPVLRCSMAQLMSHPWIKQPVNISNYVFHEIIDCDIAEANPEKYYSGSLESPRSSSLVSLAKERSLPSEVAVRSDGKNLSREEPKRNSMALHAISGGDRDAHSDNYSLRSSADILDISSKPVSDAALTDISSDATGHAACDIDCDCDHYECDSWDECEQESFS